MVMSRIQSRALGLVMEISEVCEGLSVPVCATGKLAWDCTLNGEFSDDGFHLGVMVPENRFDELREALAEGREGEQRVVVPAAVGKGKPRAFWFVATDSLMLDLTQAKNPTPGIGVFVSEVQANDGAWKLMLSPRKGAVITYDPFAETVMGSLEGFPVRLPAAPDRFFQETLGASWKTTCTYPTRRQSLSCVVSANLPHQQFLDAVSASSLDLEEVVAETRSYAKWRKEGFRAFNAETKEQVRLFDVLAQRFRLCEALLPHKAELLRAWESGKKDNVAQALEDYLTHLKEYYEFGLTLYFDKELFDLAIKALEHQGFKHAGELPGLVPPRHREVLVSDLIAPYVLDKE